VRLDKYVGIPYDEDKFDCADFVAWVQSDLFQREITLPLARPRGLRGQLALGDLSKAYAKRTETPRDGDLILFRELGHASASHAGIYFFLDHEEWVLHSNEKNACSVFHRLRDAYEFGLNIEGFYEWT
jgi:hypothetical protein